jgi:hypothetical protein
VYQLGRGSDPVTVVGSTILSVARYIGDFSLALVGLPAASIRRGADWSC